MIQTRQLILLSGDDNDLEQRISVISHTHLNGRKGVYFLQKNTTALLKDKSLHCPFSLAKNILGQENDWIIFDIRFAFNLDALAIATGTLKAGGILFILLNDWQNFSKQLDYDSQRWADGKVLNPMNFFNFFKSKVQQYVFPVLEQNSLENNIEIPPLLTQSTPQEKKQGTTEQQQILEQILAKQHDIFIITAKRGRGKSALAGLLSQSLLQENKRQLVVTAPNKKAIQVLQNFSQFEIPFMAPDALLQQLENNPASIIADYLIIDEAAMIPLPLLKKLIDYFKCVICTTTVQSYEGTGRGFILKFIQKIARPFCHLELTKPLRCIENDVLESFIEDLLFLSEAKVATIPKKLTTAIDCKFYTQKQLIEENLLEKFYQLLTLAHYRTSPSDLRRLFDGEHESFFLGKKDHDFLGGIWAISEGNIKDPELIQGIKRGERRPRGNLVAQLLTQYTNLDACCQLKSARISRIAVQPNLQGKGIGQQLVRNFYQQLKEQQELDFVSVSFGYEPQLMAFWQKCGFQLVYLSDSQIASSGCYSVVALYGLTEAGKYFIQQANKLFQRNIPLIKHPLVNILKANIPYTEIDYTLNKDDIKILQNFAYYHRPLFSSIPAITRLLKQVPQRPSASILEEYFMDNESYKKYPSQKYWLYLCRLEIQKKLTYFSLI